MIKVKKDLVTTTGDHPLPSKGGKQKSAPRRAHREMRPDSQPGRAVCVCGGRTIPGIITNKIEFIYIFVSFCPRWHAAVWRWRRRFVSLQFFTLAGGGDGLTAAELVLFYDDCEDSDQHIRSGGQGCHKIIF